MYTCFIHSFYNGTPIFLCNSESSLPLSQAREAEATYRSCVAEANDRHAALLKVKRDVLMQTRELILQCDQTMKAVTVCYFQLQHTVAAPAPVQVRDRGDGGEGGDRGRYERRGRGKGSELGKGDSKRIRGRKEIKKRVLKGERGRRKLAK